MILLYFRRWGPVALVVTAYPLLFVVYGNPVLSGVAIAILSLIVPTFAGEEILRAWTSKDILERAFWAILFTIGSSVLIGFVLNTLAAITKESWLVAESLLAGTMAVTVAVMAGGQRTVPSGDSAGVEGLENVEGSSTAPIEHPPDRFWSQNAFSLCAVTLAGLILIASLVLSEISSSHSGSKVVVQLSITPNPVLAGSRARQVRLAVRNASNTAKEFQLKLTQGSRTSTQFLILKSGDTWTRTLHRSIGEEILASISNKDTPSETLAHVSIMPPIKTSK